jgi:hypothetical protein
MANVYLNLTINNGGSTTNEPARFFVSYDQPLIPRASDFYAAVVKFECPLQSLPLFIFPIVPNQANPNLSKLQVGICEVPNPATLPNPPLTPQFIQSVIWETQNYNIPVPVQDQNFMVVTPYYYDYSYEHFVALVNRALNLAWVAGGSPGGAGNFPYFFYDVETKIINLAMPRAFHTAASGTGFGWTVFVNQDLNYYMQSFDYHKNVAGPTPRYEIATSEIATNKSFWATAPIGTITAGVPDTYLIQQEYPSNDYINSVRGIVFISNNMPVRKEYFPAPNAGQNGLVSYLGVMSDFNLDNNNTSGAQRSVAIYNAQLYNLIDLLTDVPIRSIDLQVYWKDNFNNLYPLLLGPNDVINIKMGFFSKEIFLGTKK